VKPLKTKGRHILVIDDESAVAKAIIMMLKFEGHIAEAAASGEAALAMLEQHNYELIITDYSMPGIKGDQLASLIRESRPNLPIIMVTASAEDFMAGGRPTVNVDVVIGKPFSLNSLREAISLASADRIEAK
jgi:CheY-like chemotaxis protein